MENKAHFGIVAICNLETSYSLVVQHYDPKMAVEKFPNLDILQGDFEDAGTNQKTVKIGSSKTSLQSYESVRNEAAWMTGVNDQ